MRSKILLLLTLLALQVQAADPASSAKAPSAQSSFTSATTSSSTTAVPVREAEGVLEYRLPNGLQVLLIPDASKPTTTVNVTYRVGSRMEGYGETGMAHLLEHLMFKSTTHISNVGAELSKRGMQFNGSTSVDRTNYFETFPSDAAQLAWVLATEAERMTGARVQRADLITEMTVVRNEMEAGENSPVGILIQKTQAAAYQWHSYGKNTIGARSDVENVNIPHLQDFYRKYYQPDNATLIVAGAFDAAKTLAAIGDQFGRLAKPTRVLEPTYTLEPVQDGERQVTLRRVGGQNALFVSYHIPALASPEQAAFEIIVDALADTPTGRLHKRLVEAGKATNVFGWATRNAEPGLLNVGVVLKKEDAIDAAQTILLGTIEGLAEEPITAQELQRIQQQWAAGLDKIMADPQALCVTLSESIAAGDWRLLFVQRDRVQNITLDEVNAAARAWVKSSNRSLGRFVATDQPDLSPLAQRVDAQVALQGFKPRAAVDSGEVFDTSHANLDARTERYTLPSGLKVALLPKKSRGQTVNLVLNLHLGSEPSLRGQRAAADAVANQLGMGTQTKSRTQISDAFTAINTDWHVRGSATGASAGLNTKRDQLVPALTLLAEVLREPAFSAAEFEQTQRQMLGGLAQAASDPDQIASRALARAMSPYLAGDVRYVASLPEAVAATQALTLAQVVNAYKTFWGANQAELVIVGDFDAAQIKPVIDKLLGHWAAASSYTRVPRPASAVTGQRLLAQVKDKPNALALGRLPLLLADTDPDHPALTLAAHVLGAGGFDSRLLTRLRQKDGLSYGAGASLDASSFEPAGTLTLYAIFAPQNRQRVESGFAEELAQFVKDGITADELVSAKKAMLAGSNTWRAVDAAVAGAWASRLELGRVFVAWDAVQEAKLAALTVAQVNAAIRKWIDPNRVNWSLAGDFEKAP